MTWVSALGRERTDEEQAERRARSVRAWGDLQFTCDKCRDSKTCDYAFDSYNTDGDCLAEK